MVLPARVISNKNKVVVSLMLTLAVAAVDGQRSLRPVPAVRFATLVYIQRSPPDLNPKHLQQIRCLLRSIRRRKKVDRPIFLPERRQLVNLE